MIKTCLNNNSSLISINEGNINKLSKYQLKENSNKKLLLSNYYKNINYSKNDRIYMKIISEEKSLKKFKKRLNQFNIDLNILINNSKKQIYLGKKFSIINYLLCFTIEYNKSIDIFEYIIEKCQFRKFNELEKFNCLLFAMVKNSMDKADILLRNNIQLSYYYIDSFYNLDNNNRNIYENIEYIFNKGIRDVNDIQDFLDSWYLSKKNDKIENQIFKILFNKYERIIKSNNKKFIGIHSTIEIHGKYYEKAIENENYFIIKNLFSHDSCEKEEMINKIEKYKLLYYVINLGFQEKDVLTKDFLSFIDDILSYEQLQFESIISKEIISDLNLYDKDNTISEYIVNKFFILYSKKIKKIEQLIDYTVKILNIAIKKEHLKLVKYLLESDKFKELIDVNYKTLLENNESEKSINIYDKKFNEHILKYPDNKSRTPLENAINHFYSPIIMVLINNGAKISHINEKRKNLFLINAVEDSDKDCIDFLLQQEIDINYVNPVNQKNALIIAVEKRNYDIIKSLIKNGANVNHVQQETGKSILMYALDSDDFNIINLLIHYGANVNYIQENNKKSILEYTIELISEQYKLMPIQSEVIFPQGILISNTTFTNHLIIFKLLVNKGADINYENTESKETMLMKVIGFQNTEILSNFLKFDVDINRKNSESKSAIGIVLEKCVKLKKYMNEISKNIDKQSVKDLFSKQEMYNNFKKTYEINKNIFELLIETNAKKQNSSKLYMNENILRIIISNGLLDLLKILIKNNFDINIKDNDGDTILNYAINAENKDIMNYILSYSNFKIDDLNDNDNKELINLLIGKTD